MAFIYRASCDVFILLCNLTRRYFQDSNNDDEEERHQFGVSENVLDQSAPLHIGTVDEDEHTWSNRRTKQ